MVQEAFEFSGADGVLELADGLGLDLADALAGDFEDAADLFERVGVAVADAVTQLDNLALAVGERLEDDVDAVLEHFLRGRGDGRIDLVVLDEIAEVAVLALADGPVEADGMLGDFQDAARLLDGHFRFLGDLTKPLKNKEMRLGVKIFHFFCDFFLAFCGNPDQNE